MKRSYWLYMEPYVYISVKRGTALVYNTLNGKIIETGGPGIVNLVKKLDSKKNLLVARLTGDQLKNPEISSFVKEVKEHYSGDLIDISLSQGKPIQMLPRVKVQKDVEKIGAAGESVVGEQVMDNLAEISLYINNRCPLDCLVCETAYKQFLTCTKGRKPLELDVETIGQFLREAMGNTICGVNILGGDIFAYSRFRELVHFLNNFYRPKTYHSHYLNLPNRRGKIELIDSDLSSLRVIIDFPVSKDKLEEVVKLLTGIDIPVEYVFCIPGEKEIDAAQDISSRLKIDNYTLKPFYNGENFDFFKDNVFVNKQELLQLKPGLKEIFSRMKLNPLNFGKITVLSNRFIYANVNENKIGELGRDSLYDVVFKEMYHGRSWRKSRNKVEPCKSCVFCFLCPPLTNYEYWLKRNNLCHIWE